MSARRRAVVGVDIGGTNVKIGVFSERTIRSPRSVATGVDDGLEHILRRVSDEVSAVIHESEAEGTRVGGVGVGVPGLVDREAGRVLHAANLGWSDVPLSTLLSRELRLPVWVDNDVYLGALAEARLGAASGAQAALFVAIGTGVAASCVGAVGTWRGANGFAGELGFTRTPDLVEDAVSARGLTTEYERWTGRSKRPDEIAGSLDEDHISRLVWARFCDDLGLAVWNAVALLDPSHVVLGGGLAEAGSRLVEPVAAALAVAAPDFRPIPQVMVAEFGWLAGCVGAGVMATEKLAVHRP
ncbi:MAG: ROK family protein [Actinomycetota bacterium]